MIPVTVDDLGALVAEARRQSEELDAVVADRDPETLSARPDPSKWSPLGHVAHLCLVNLPYLATIEAAIARAREAGGPSSAGPYRHPLVARWFARSMEPPPKRRMRTMRSMVPDPSVAHEDTVERFQAGQRRLAELIDGAGGLEPGSHPLRLALLRAAEALPRHLLRGDPRAQPAPLVADPRGARGGRPDHPFRGRRLEVNRAATPG